MFMAQIRFVACLIILALSAGDELDNVTTVQEEVGGSNKNPPFIYFYYPCKRVDDLAKHRRYVCHCMAISIDGHKHWGEFGDCSHWAGSNPPTCYVQIQFARPPQYATYSVKEYIPWSARGSWLCTCDKTEASCTSVRTGLNQLRPHGSTVQLVQLVRGTV